MIGTGGESQLVSCGIGLEQKISWRLEDQWEERVLVSFGRGLEGRVNWGPEVHWKIAGEESQLDQKTSWRRLKRESKLETCGRRVSWTRRPVGDG